jgi:hypothetical protein
MNVMTAAQLVLVEVALWMFCFQAADIFFVSGGSVLLILGIVLKRFGFSEFIKMFNLKSIISIPVLFLFASAFTSGSLSAILEFPSKTLVLPLKEELIYRLVIPGIVRGRSFSGLTSVLTSTALFGFSHRHMYPIFSGDMAVCIFAAFALSFRTIFRNKDSIIEAFAIHSLHNAHAIRNHNAGSQIMTSPLLFYSGILVWDIYCIKALSRKIGGMK